MHINEFELLSNYNVDEMISFRHDLELFHGHLCGNCTATVIDDEGFQSLTLGQLNEYVAECLREAIEGEQSDEPYGAVWIPEEVRCRIGKTGNRWPTKFTVKVIKYSVPSHDCPPSYLY